MAVDRNYTRALTLLNFWLDNRASPCSGMMRTFSMQNRHSADVSEFPAGGSRVVLLWVDPGGGEAVSAVIKICNILIDNNIHTML